jgi:thiol:disulfide interchange protein DsbD
MTILITLVALNLFGVFEVNLGGAAMGAAGNLAAKEGNAGAFFNGVLATTLATPCTAPFLAPALGFAFAQPPGIIVLIFLTIGAGLAAPYVVLSWQPAWLKYLPKPGAWMEKFKVAMGFPMLATAVWLLTLSTRRLGEEGVLWMGLFLVGLGLAAWIWGEFVQRGRKRIGLSMALCLAVLIFSYAYILEGQLHWRSACAKSFLGVRETKQSERDSVAAVEPRGGAKGPFGRAPGVRRFHRVLVFDLPGEQKNQHRDPVGPGKTEGDQRGNLVGRQLGQSARNRGGIVSF